MAKQSKAALTGGLYALGGIRQAQFCRLRAWKLSRRSPIRAGSCPSPEPTVQLELERPDRGSCSRVVAKNCARTWCLSSQRLSALAVILGATERINIRHSARTQPSRTCCLSASLGDRAKWKQLCLHHCNWSMQPPATVAPHWRSCVHESRWALVSAIFAEPTSCMAKTLTELIRPQHSLA